MEYLKFARLPICCAVISALSGCFVSAGGTTPLDPGNPNGARVGTNVQYDLETGTAYPTVSIGTGPIRIGL